MPMRSRNKKTNDKDLVSLGVLYDGAEDDAPTPMLDAAGVGHIEPAVRSRQDTATAPAPAPQAQVPEVINPRHYRMPDEYATRPGEDAWAYLDRITLLLLKELVMMATAPVSVVNAKVKLDALRELIQRPMPARQVYDIRTPAAGSEFDRMSDTQVMDFVHKQIADMRKEEVAVATAALPQTPEDKEP
jgi:hypothetical protein